MNGECRHWCRLMTEAGDTCIDCGTIVGVAVPGLAYPGNQDLTGVHEKVRFEAEKACSNIGGITGALDRVLMKHHDLTPEEYEAGIYDDDEQGEW